MWRSGPPRGCDAALRPRGRAASGPRGVQEALSGAATWQGGHATTWAPVWGATCRLVIEGDGDEINRRMHPPPPHLTATNAAIFSVWDYVPTRSYLLQVTWCYERRRIRSRGEETRRSRGPESTRSPIKARAQMII